jgi:hypothetical protein
VKVGKLATRRRRIATVAVAGIVLATGTGAAYAYFTPGERPIADPANYFTYCADRQRDVAGITLADLEGTSNGGHDYTIENFVHLEAHPAGQPYDGDEPFVLGKSGIAYAPVGAAPPAVPEQDYTRRIVTTQIIEYHPTETNIDGSPLAVQVRCKMRTRESLNRPESEKQRFGGPTSTSFSSVPWGFGAGTATGTQKACRVVQADIATDVWNLMSEEEQNAAVYRWADAPDGDLANVTVAEEILPVGYAPPSSFGTVTPDTNVFVTGTQWTSGHNPTGFDSVRIKNGALEIRSAVLNALSTDPSNPIGDRVAGAYYCTFSTAEYLKAVFLGDVTPPTAVP